MKIYTKSGDKGKTSLLGGDRVKKFDLRINAYGTSDELNSWIGLIKDQSIKQQHKDFLLEVQDRIFTIGSNLSALGNKKSTFSIPEICEKDVFLVEKEIDLLQESLSPMTSFILPGGHTIVSYCHLARTVCRRCERIVIQLSESEDVSPFITQYLNRLSDYLFVLSRKLAVDLNVDEIPWHPKK